MITQTDRTNICYGEQKTIDILNGYEDVIPGDFLQFSGEKKIPSLFKEVISGVVLGINVNPNPNCDYDFIDIMLIEDQVENQEWSPIDSPIYPSRFDVYHKKDDKENLYFKKNYSNSSLRQSIDAVTASYIARYPIISKHIILRRSRFAEKYNIKSNSTEYVEKDIGYGWALNVNEIVGEDYEDLGIDEEKLEQYPYFKNKENRIMFDRYYTRNLIKFRPEFVYYINERGILSYNLYRDRKLYSPICIRLKINKK